MDTQTFIETLLMFLVPLAIITMIFGLIYYPLVYCMERKRHKRTLDELRHSNNGYKKEIKEMESILHAYERYVKKMEEKAKSSSQEQP